MRALVTVILAVAYLSMTGCATFSDGFAAIRGEGGTIARVDGFPIAVANMERLPPQPAPHWYGELSSESADLIEFVDPERVLIGTVEVEAYLGVPQHKALILYNARTGAKLWAASRPALTNGEYRVLAVQPHILVLGSDANSLHLIALDRGTGRTIWSLTRPMPTRLAPGHERLHLLVATKGETATTYALESVELRSGRVVARDDLAPELFGSSPASLHRLERDLVLAGRRLARLSPQNGTVAWSTASRILERGEASIAVLPQGIVVHDTSAAALYRPSDGRLVWEHAANGIKLLAAAGERHLVLVLARPEGDVLRLLRLHDGRVVWENGVRASITSPIALVHGLLVFTTDTSLIGWRVTDGHASFAATLPGGFKLGSPRYPGALGQPDVLRIDGGRLYVARERAGVIAFSLPAGRYLWHQFLREPYPGASPYSAAALSSQLNFELEHYRHLGIPAPSVAVPAAMGAGYASAGSPTARLMLSSAQWDYAQATRAGDTQKQLLALGRMEVAQRMEAFNQQMATTQALFGALMSVNLAIARALQMEAVKGLAARKTMQLRAAIRLHRNAFQGGFHVSPFETTAGLGVTLVELASGKRADLFFAPQILAGAGMNLPTFRISPDGRQLLMVGTGLDPSRFEPYVKWKWRLPRPALLSYDFADVKFERVNARFAAERKEGVQAFHQRAPLMLVNFAGSGDIGQVEFLLDAGVDVNSRYPTGDTPLMAAALGGHVEIVKLLLARGADPDITNEQGKRAADLAQTPEIAGLLADAMRAARQ